MEQATKLSGSMLLKGILFLLFCGIAVAGRSQGSVTLSKEALLDKIKGGWAGQTIGVTFGGPTEFQYEGSFIDAQQPIKWYDGYLKENMLNNAGLYDDLYMDLSFVQVFDRLGLDAPVDSFAQAFAHTGFNLWHQNQAARWNILHGRPSGHWLHNPHANDIGYLIEADYAGLMSPGMPNTSADINDRIGHIITYGEGWYGGVYVGALYSLAFVSSDVQAIVYGALKLIPEQSPLHRCIADVIRWHKQYPADWKQAWFEIQKKWAGRDMCPEGVFRAFNIDAKVNLAYVVLSLLYGNGDYSRTLDIATRAGQDSDCNPSTAGGVLGTMMGYKNIPAYWKLGLSEIEDMDFKYTTVSLNKAYDMSYRHALELIRRNGGQVRDRDVVIRTQAPQVVRWEQGFEGLYPSDKIRLRVDSNEIRFDFTGSGFVIRGRAAKRPNLPDDVILADLYVDGQKIESADLSTAFFDRRHELFWRYQLADTKHAVRVVITNPKAGYELQGLECVVYAGKPPEVGYPE
ncbi:MAG: ADP-ribosylglycohydrolase family protein [Chitinophagaceae bacterium]